MSSSTSSSEARRFLLVFAALVIASELAFTELLPLDRGRHEVDHLAAVTESGALSGQAVLLADSVCYDVLTGRSEAEWIIDLASNQSIGVAGNLFLLQRLLDSTDEPPAVVAYVASPLSLDESFIGPLTPTYFTSVFLNGDEIAYVEEELRREDLTVSMRSARGHRRWMFPSNLRAGNVTQALNVWLRDVKRLLHGKSAPPRELSRVARLNIEERVAIESFATSPETDTALEDLARVTSEIGARLALVSPPIAPTIEAAWKESGYWQQYLEALSAFAERHPHVIFAPVCPYRPDEDRLFADGVHLTPAGKDAWAHALTVWIRRIWSESR